MKQKTGTIAFAIIVIIGIIVISMSKHYKTGIPAFWTADSATIHLFEDSIIDLQTAYEAKWEQQNKKYPKPSLPPLNRHIFDPNTADSIELLEQGFLPWQVGNMMKYRSKGGKWKKAEDVRKIYGVDSTFYAEIEPYILINDSLFALPDSTKSDSSKLHFTVKKDTIIELNSADTAELQLIKHIGSFTARQIVFYRERLGGFYNVRQLEEIKDLHADTYDKIKDSFTVDTTLIKTININRASVSQLGKHPYIRAQQAKAIYDYRRRQIKIKDLSEIQQLGIFDSEEWLRIRRYLSLE